MLLARNNTTVVVPWRGDLANLIPHARELVHGGEKFLMFPNDMAEARLARNLGVPVPSPILTRYDWGGHVPWEVQKQTAAVMIENERVFVLNDLGTGKTRAAIFAAVFLLRLGAIRRVLISTPLSTMVPVWERELFHTFPNYKVRVLHGPRTLRLRRLGEAATFYIINHHGVPMMTAELAAAGFDVMVIDELAVLRNAGTQLWKGHATVVNAIPRVWGMTGAPTPKAPTDAWAQVRLLRPGNVSRTMGFFRDQTMRRVTQFRWVPRVDANDIVHNAMQPSVRFTRGDVMELPPTTYVDRRVTLDPTTAKIYKMLFDRMRALSDQGKPITAANEGILHGKLLQVACGYLYTDDKTVYALPNKPRLDALDETLEACAHKVIIFVPYVHALSGISQHLRAQGYDIATVHGGTPSGRRNEIFDGFQNDVPIPGRRGAPGSPPPRVIVAHPQCMAHGLTLTAADTIIWYSAIPNLDIYEQANARIVRPSQTRNTLIVHLCGTTVETLTYARLRQRSRMQGVLMDMFGQPDLLAA
jgi:SNF2 family DNA or RNA helicase